jgi:hypothetical protein
VEKTKYTSILLVLIAIGGVVSASSFQVTGYLALHSNAAAALVVTHGALDLPVKIQRIINFHVSLINLKLKTNHI